MEQGVFERLNDISALAGFYTGLYSKRFFLLGNAQKLYYPKLDDGIPFEVKLNLSRKTHVYKEKVYTLLALATEIGGLSGSILFIGSLVAYFTAKRLQKAELMQDIFMT